ncbi:MAG: hypothetical protein CVU56_11445 [Deltaproteobacteria bacterium HGW-Deltaproteobacteria-14]|nr:MAG: hypothetical protein CVU56_11445 [Deltaproteobacteria bacterium HGW-Deltaproteobacteria-14]
MAIWGCLTLGACASASIVAPPRPGVVRFVNTSETCAHPMAVTVAAGAAWAVVAPGAAARLELSAGDVVVVIRAADGSEAELGRQTWSVPAGAATTQFFGCAAPRFLSPDPDLVSVAVRATPWGCRPGLVGVARLAVAGEPFAQVAPGRSVTRFVAPGPLTVRIDVPGVAPIERVVEVGAEGGAIEVGCAPSAVAGPHVAVLAAFGPDPACGLRAREVTAAGVTAELTPGEVYTFVLSPGRTRVVTRDAGGAPAAMWLDLPVGGTTLPAPVCAGPEGGR